MGILEEKASCTSSGCVPGWAATLKHSSGAEGDCKRGMKWPHHGKLTDNLLFLFEAHPDEGVLEGLAALCKVCCVGARHVVRV